MKLFRLPLALLATLSIFTASSAYAPDYYLIPNGADGDVAQARQEFERFYRDLTLHGHFDLSYNNNLTINTLLDGDVQKEGAIMLTLLNWLAHRKDHDSKFLLKRLNHLYFLELHSLFSNIDSNKDATARMLQLCDQFYHYKTINPITQQTRKPFRTSLSRLFIVITTINGSDMAYETRKKSMALALERVGNKMLRINKRLGDQKMYNSDITAFISLLSTHVAVEPLVRTSFIRNVILGTLITVAIITLIYRYREPIGDGLAAFAQITKKTLQTMFGFIGEGLGDGILRSAAKPENRECVRAILQEGGNSLIHGMATNATGQPNQDVALLSSQLINGALTKQPHQNVPAHTTVPPTPHAAPMAATDVSAKPATQADALAIPKVAVQTIAADASTKSSAATEKTATTTVVAPPLTTAIPAPTIPATPQATTRPAAVEVNPDVKLAADTFLEGLQQRIPPLLEDTQQRVTTIVNNLHENIRSGGRLGKSLIGPSPSEQAAAAQAAANAEAQRLAAIAARANNPGFFSRVFGSRRGQPSTQSVVI